MCAIVALAGARASAEQREAALDAVAHRGPDGAGHWSDDGIWLGHRRLKVIDLSERAAQPMANEDGQVRLTFNGEIYNFVELRRELEQRGHRFSSDGDGEVILHAYEEYGDRCVERLWGMFAFVIWDRRQRRLLAARDRFGKKPLCYVKRSDSLALASEIPALLALGVSTRRVNLNHLSFFWNLGYIPAPASAFDDVAKLPAGHALSWQDGELRVWRYYPPRRVAPFDGTYEEAIDEFKGLVRDAVRRRLVSDVPLGVALSGGLDSACVTSFAREVRPDRLLTFTVRPDVPGGEYDEGPEAQATARRLGTQHFEIVPGIDLAEGIETVVRRVGEPFAIGSATPCYYLFKAMKPHATVVLSGDGGDELFAGYPGYRYARALALVRRLAPRATSEALYRLLDLTYGGVAALRPTLQRLMVVLQLVAGRPPSDARWEHRQILQPESYRAWLLSDLVRDYRDRLLALFSEREPARLEMVADQFDNMSCQILSKVDVTSMAHGVEVRSPLLDHRIAEFARSLPTSYLLRNGKGKQLMRDCLAEVLPPEVLHKKKTGFGLPFSQWLAGDGRRYALELLQSPSATFDAVVRRERTAELIARHGAGGVGVTTLLLRLIALRLWIEQTRATLA